MLGDWNNDGRRPNFKKIYAVLRSTAAASLMQDSKGRPTYNWFDGLGPYPGAEKISGKTLLTIVHYNLAYAMNPMDVVLPGLVWKTLYEEGMLEAFRIKIEGYIKLNDTTPYTLGLWDSDGMLHVISIPRRNQLSDGMWRCTIEDTASYYTEYMDAVSGLPAPRPVAA